MIHEFTKWKNQYIDLLHTKPDYIGSVRAEHDIPAVKERLTGKSKLFSKIFVELGSGSGGHLIELALKNPESLCVGFELRFKRVFRTAEKAEEQAIKNLFVIQGDAKLLRDFFEPSSISGIYVNFPDPWDKKRWKKHRLLTPAFLDELLRLLKPSGTFSHKSDHPEYFTETLTAFKSLSGATIERVTTDLYKSDYSEENIASEFEKLFHDQKIPIHLFIGRKLAD